MSRKNFRGAKGELVRLWGNVCWYCKKEFLFDALTVDHKTPRSRGGKDHFDNLCLACADCNTEKRDMTEHEYSRFKRMDVKAQMRFLNQLYLDRVKRTFTEANFSTKRVRPPKERMTYKIEEVWVEIDKREFRGNRIGSAGIDDRFPNLSQWPAKPSEDDIRERNRRNKENSDDS